MKSNPKYDEDHPRNDPACYCWSCGEFLGGIDVVCEDCNDNPWADDNDQ